MVVGEFNIFEQLNVTNNDINIVFMPDSSITRYEYCVIKDDVYGDYIQINNNEPTTIFLTETGIFQIEIKAYDKNNNVSLLNSGTYNIDKDKPIIELSDYHIEIPVGYDLDVMAGIKAYDKQSGDLIDKVTTNYDELDLTTTGLKKLVYTVSDDAGNVKTATVEINVVKDYSTRIFIFQVGMGAIILFILGLYWFYRRSIKLEKRISRYSVKPIKDSSLSLLENISRKYKTVIIKLSKFLEKSVFIKKYSLHYEKYVGTIDKVYSRGIEYISNKIIISFIFLVIAFFSKTIQSEILSSYELVIPLTVGFFVPDLIYIYKYSVYRKQIENDLLQAIIIMNNAFKSGRSISQAVELVSNELEGPIAEEFKKMYLEISFGLSINVVFKRFSERVKLEEVTYLTASLSILNKTGGNIIKVFSSIEKSLFNKKKLKLELQSLTSSSKIIVYVLTFMPIAFIVFISIINPSYFEPLFTTEIGFILMALIITIYITYLIFIRKIMRVRMWKDESKAPNHSKNIS